MVVGMRRQFKGQEDHHWICSKLSKAQHSDLPDCRISSLKLKYLFIRLVKVNTMSECPIEVVFLFYPRCTHLEFSLSVSHLSNMLKGHSRARRRKILLTKAQ